MTIKNINPYSKTVFNYSIVKYKGKLYTYLFFNNFSSQEISYLYKVIDSIDRNVETKIILNKKSYNTTLRELNKQLKQLFSTKKAEQTEESDLIMKSIKKGINFVQDTFNEHRLVELERVSSELSSKRERIIESQSGETNLALILRVEVENQSDATKVCDSIELKALECGFNIQQGLYCQKMLHQAFTGQIKKYEFNEFLSINPDVGSVTPKHLQFSIEQEEVSTLTLDYFPTTKLTESSIYLGDTMSSNSPYFVEFGTSVKEADNVLVIGQQGAGKSATVKDKIKQLHNLGYRIIVLDPKQDEYKAICQSCEGFEIDASQLSGINLLDLKQFDSLIDINPMFQTILETITGAELSKEQKADLNSILNLMKTEEKSDLDSFLLKIEKSSLSSYVEALKNERLLKLLTSNESKELKDIKNRFIRFSFNKISGSELNLFVMIVAKVINTICDDTSTPTILVIDEAFKFLSQGSTSKQIIQWFRILRSYNIRIWCLEQDARNYGELAETLFSLSQHCFFFKHSPIKQFDIPDDLYQKVATLKGRDSLGHQFLYINRDNNETVFLDSIVADNHLEYV